jgi:hypothetical protein
MFKKLKTKVCLLRADIGFLKKCKRNKIIPDFIQQTIHSKSKSRIVRNVICDARQKMLKLEIKKHYENSDLIRRELYSLHLFLLKNIHPINEKRCENVKPNFVINRSFQHFSQEE